MLGKGGGAEEASRAKLVSTWGKFNEFAQILTMKGASLRCNGNIYKACVQSILVYGSATWTMNVNDMRIL